MKRLFLYFIFFISCLQIFGQDYSWVNELDRINTLLEKEIYKKHHLFMTGTGGGSVLGFELYSLQFQQFSPTTKDDSRELILSLSQQILKKINANEILKNGMLNYPFTHKNLGLVVFFRKSDGSFVSEGDISSVCINIDSIEYALHTEKIAPKKRIYEPIREALEKVEGSRQKFPFIWECVEKQEAEVKEESQQKK